MRERTKGENILRVHNHLFFRKKHQIRYSVGGITWASHVRDRDSSPRIRALSYHLACG